MKSMDNVSQGRVALGRGSVLPNGLVVRVLIRAQVLQALTYVLTI